MAVIDHAFSADDGVSSVQQEQHELAGEPVDLPAFPAIQRGSPAAESSGRGSDEDPEWMAQAKHIFVLSNAGTLCDLLVLRLLTRRHEAFCALALRLVNSFSRQERCSPGVALTFYFWRCRQANIHAAWRGEQAGRLHGSHSCHDVVCSRQRRRPSFPQACPAIPTPQPAQFIRKENG